MQSLQGGGKGRRGSTPRKPFPHFVPLSMPAREKRGQLSRRLSWWGDGLGRGCSFWAGGGDGGENPVRGSGGGILPLSREREEKRKKKERRHAQPAHTRRKLIPHHTTEKEADFYLLHRRRKKTQKKKAGLGARF